MTDFIKYATIYNYMKDSTDINVSHDSVTKVQKALNCLGNAIIQSAYVNAVVNNRKTILETDVDCALDSLYNYFEAWDEIFSEDVEWWFSYFSFYL